MKFTLALQTPSVLLNVLVKDVAGKTDQLQVEFKRYEAKEAYEQMAIMTKLGDSASHIFEGINLASDIAKLQASNLEVALNAEKLEKAQEALNDLTKQHPTLLEDIKGISSIWESPVLVQAPEFKKFIRDNIVDIKNDNGIDEETGKKIKLSSLAEAGELDKYFKQLWKSLPYREALRNVIVQVIQNTASTQ